MFKKKLKFMQGLNVRFEWFSAKKLTDKNNINLSSKDSIK